MSQNTSFDQTISDPQCADGLTGILLWQMQHCKLETYFGLKHGTKATRSHHQ